MLYQLGKIRGKAVRESLRRNAEVQPQIEALSNLLYPTKLSRSESIWSLLSLPATGLILSNGCTRRSVPIVTTIRCWWFRDVVVTCPQERVHSLS